MKIAIEAQRIFRKKKHGMDLVVIALIKNLMKIDSVNEYYIFVKPGKDKCLESCKNFNIVELKSSWYPFWEQFALPKAVKQYQCEILHCTSNTAPLFAGVPLIILLHDIIYLEGLKIFKSTYSNYQRMGNIYRKLLIPMVVKRAQKIVTVSNFEAKEITKVLNIEKGKLHCIYNTVGVHFKPISNPFILEFIKKKYQLPEQYFLFFANTDLKKNTLAVLQAFGDYVKKKGSQTKLVLLDGSKSDVLSLLKKIKQEQLQKDIYLLGYVKNTDLPAIYSLCSVFLYPSLRESFGLPIIEAMKCGVPVMTSNISAMPEIAEDAAYLVNPSQPEEISLGLSQIMTNSNLRKDLVNKGLKRADQFSGELMAKQNLKLYHELKN